MTSARDRGCPSRGAEIQAGAVRPATCVCSVPFDATERGAHRLPPAGTGSAAILSDPSIAHHSESAPEQRRRGPDGLLIWARARYVPDPICGASRCPTAKAALSVERVKSRPYGDPDLAQTVLVRCLEVQRRQVVRHGGLVAGRCGVGVASGAELLAVTALDRPGQRPVDRCLGRCLNPSSSGTRIVTILEVGSMILPSTRYLKVRSPIAGNRPAGSIAMRALKTLDGAPARRRDLPPSFVKSLQESVLGVAVEEERDLRRDLVADVEQLSTR